MASGPSPTNRTSASLTGGGRTPLCGWRLAGKGPRRPRPPVVDERWPCVRPPPIATSAVTICNDRFPSTSAVRSSLKTGHSRTNSTSLGRHSLVKNGLSGLAAHAHKPTFAGHSLNPIAARNAIGLDRCDSGRRRRRLQPARGRRRGSQSVASTWTSKLIHARARSGLLGENQTLGGAFATGFWSVH